MKVISTPNAPAAIGPYSQGYEVNGLVYTSGQIPVDPADGSVPEGIEAQAHQSCRNVGAVLALSLLVPTTRVIRRCRLNHRL